ncbi:nucleotidyl transferase AbiEii/AbiGii toxin family protein [Magnetovirga frankeli]|uniref:nucleotidyl transferase AbiEii/AbiGii toxin family protein n=1 Tax=Magnetovirga frankeli TaxID=947516 RepID=UPI0012934770|nr:nucleotidyl transferase AbiEii/AbiGii toxin family protein [gamma proteobacterium SS-5]
MKIGDLLQALNNVQVDYVLVGGLAVQMHGFLRATIDIDLVLAMNEANLERFIQVAQGFNLVPVVPVPLAALKDKTQVEEWYQHRNMLAFALREPAATGMVVDVMIRPEPPFEKLLADATKAQLFGQDVWIASIEDLISMKLKANRPKDHLDIEALRKILRGEDPNA